MVSEQCKACMVDTAVCDTELCCVVLNMLLLIDIMGEADTKSLEIRLQNVCQDTELNSVMEQCACTNTERQPNLSAELT